MKRVKQLDKQKKDNFIKCIKTKFNNLIKSIKEFNLKTFVINRIKAIKKYNYKQYRKTNILFFSTIISLVINDVILRAMTVGNVFDFKPILGDLAVLLLVLAPAYFIKPRKRIIYYSIASILLTAVCIINSIYYTYYSSFASVSLLSASLQVVDVADAVTKNVMQLRDFIYIWQPLFVILLFIYLKRKNYFNLVEKVEKSKKRVVATLGIGVSVLLVFIMSLTSLEIGRFIKQWNREFIVMKFGTYIYQVNDVFVSIEPRINAVFGYDAAAKKVKTYYEENPVVKTTNKYTNIFKDKNLLVIHGESIQQFVIGLKINGVEVTPNLNRLTKEGLYFSNFYSQAGVGTSSDTEFTINTSLLPSTNGTVFVSYWNREYVSIPKLLKEQGYYAFSMHGNKADMWNRAVMHKSLGYDRFYSKVDYKIDDVIGLGLSDKSFFRQSVPMIKKISEKYQNFYGTMIMLSNHTPFDDVEKYGDFPVTMSKTVTKEDGTTSVVEMPYMEGTELGNYLKSVHYADAALGEFMDELDAAGILENTVIALYGDHDARLPAADYKRLYNYDPTTGELKDDTDPTYKDVDYYAYEINRKVPFFIWTKDKKVSGEVTKVMGMDDVLPTLGNMYGFSSPYALGNDIFSVQDNSVIFPNGNWLTQDVYYNGQKQEFKVLNDKSVISQEYIDKYNKEATDKIEVSNNIIVYDYIKKTKEAQTVLESTKW